MELTWLADAIEVGTEIVGFAKANPEIFLPALAAVVFGLTKMAISAVKKGAR